MEIEYSYPDFDDYNFLSKIYVTREYYINIPPRKNLISYEEIKKFRDGLCGCRFKLTV